MIPNWVIGVLLACLASIVSNLGLNLQKLNHTLNEQKIRAESRRKRQREKEAAAAENAAKGATPGHAFGVTGTKILHDYHAAAAAAAAAEDEESGRLDREAQSYQNSPTAAIHPLFLHNSSSSSSEARLANTRALTPSQQRHLAAYAQLNAIDYSKQKMWRAGLALVTLGSILDFTALIFAAQSIVAPLGSLTLVSNTVFAPLLLGESISRRDLIATGAIVCGACMAIIGADHSGAILPIEDLFACFLTERFMLYALIVSIVLISLFYTKVWCTHIQLTDPRRYTKESLAGLHRFTYASLAGIMGAQSVLFAKCTGEILVNMLGAEPHSGHGRDDDDSGDSAKSPLTHYWQTYFVLLCLGCSIFFQISWLNSGLKHFEALYIVPVFQSFWILVSVVAGMITWGEYRAIFRSPMSTVMFTMGVLVTIGGVWVLSQRGGTHAKARAAQETPQQRDYRHYRPAQVLGAGSVQQQQQWSSESEEESASASASDQSPSPSPNLAPATGASLAPTQLARASSVGSTPRSSSASQAALPFVSPSGVLAPLASYQSLDAASSAALLASNPAGPVDGDDDDDGDLEGRSFVSPAPPIAFLSGAFLDQTMLSSSWKEEAPIAKQARNDEAQRATAAAARAAAAAKSSGEDSSNNPTSSSRPPRSDARAVESSPLLVAATKPGAGKPQHGHHTSRG